jgi:hypothetical protein
MADWTVSRRTYSQGPGNALRIYGTQDTKPYAAFGQATSAWAAGTEA